MQEPALSDAQLDDILTRQLVVAWAGERGEDVPRLGWWATQLDEEFGGRDLFDQLLPRTGAWAVLVAAREAARRVDQFARQAADSHADQLSSLFHFGFFVDEQLNDRLRDHQQRGATPRAALPGLTAVLSDDPEAPFDPARLTHWCDGLGPVKAKHTSIGRELALLPAEPLSRRLVAALAPLAPTYPLPYARMTP